MSQEETPLFSFPIVQSFPNYLFALDGRYKGWKNLKTSIVSLDFPNYLFALDGRYKGWKNLKTSIVSLDFHGNLIQSTTYEIASLFSFARKDIATQSPDRGIQYFL